MDLKVRVEEKKNELVFLLFFLFVAAFFRNPVFAEERAEAAGGPQIMISASGPRSGQEPAVEGPEEAVLEIKKNNELVFLKRSVFAIIFAVVLVIAAVLLYGLRSQLLKKLIKRKRGATTKNTH